MKPTPCLRPIHLVSMIVLMGGLAASVTQAAPPPLPPINQTPTGLQLTGKLIWFDLVTRDVAAAKQFYGAVFGWTFSDVPDAQRQYTVISTGNERIGGIFHPLDATKVGPTARWLTFVSVPDVAAATRYASSNGGQVVSGPTSVPARGTHVVLRDPEGALFGVLKSDSGDPADEPAKPGEFLWADVFVAKPANAATFYGGLVGWKSDDNAIGTGGPAKRLVMNASGFSRAGITMLPAGAKPGWLPYVQVTNVPAAVRRVTRAGGKILTPPNRDLLEGRLAIIADPQGGVIGIVNWTGASKKGRRQ